MLAGALDITAAIVVVTDIWEPSPSRCCKASPAEFSAHARFPGDSPPLSSGLFFQFFIATSAAAVYVLASRAIPFLIDSPFVAGPLYGTAVYFFMNRIVVPLSAARKYPFTVRGMVIGIMIHIFCIGLPIALVTNRYARR